MDNTKQQGAAQLETQEKNEEIIKIENPAFQQKIFVAVGKDLCESVHALKWALENLDRRQEILVILLHIQRPVRHIPSAIGKIPVDQVREDIVKGYMKAVEKELNCCLKKYLDICTNAKVKAETLVVKKNGVTTGIVEVVSELGISSLVMGTSSASSSISRKMKIVARGKAEYVRSHVIESCDLWIVHKDKLVSHNAARSLKSHVSSLSETSGTLLESPANDQLDLDICNRSTSIFPVTGNSPPASGEELNGSRIIVATNEVSSESKAACSPESSFDEGFSLRTLQLGHHGSQDVQVVKTRLRDALKLSQKAKKEAPRETGKRKKAEAAAVNANLKFTELEAITENRVEIKGEEIVRFQDSIYSRPRIETLTSMSSFSSHNLEFSEYSFDDIKAATCNFSEHFKLGEGASATVYKGEIRKTTVAVKILKKRSLNSQREFHREINILRSLRHPHLVRAVGACFERGCIIYEYMSNGCLVDHLSCKNTSPALPWHARIRIAAEVCSALQYLHSLKPDPVIHGDLKPENILLDENFVSKISDFGLARSLSDDILSHLEPKGRFSYMDPEYLTSAAYCTKSDVYSLGIVILRLLTGKRTLRLREDTECALQGGRSGLVLDPSAGNWPSLQATQLAYLALQCTDPVREKRPDLQPTVMKMLDRLREMAVPSSNPARRSMPQKKLKMDTKLCCDSNKIFKGCL